MARPGTSEPRLGDQHDTEIEWQFDALDLRPVERWLATLPGRSGTPGANGASLTARAKPTRRLVDRYLDTEDWRLGRAGLVMRIRHRGRHDEVTLKDTKPATEAGLRTRLEVTEPLPEDGLTALGDAGPVGRRVRAVAGPRPLREVLVVRTRRRPFSLQLNSEEVAEVALDDTVIGIDHQPPAHLHRIEIELTEGANDRVEPWVDDMRRACGLQPAALSKFEAGLLALGMEIPGSPDLGPVTVSETSTLGELAYAVLRRQLGVLVAKEPGTRLGEDIEELHDMRVATRRLRAALDLFSDALPARAAGLRNELAWLGALLGDVRDLDVQLDRMDEMERWTTPWLGEDADEPPLDALRTLLESERHQARDRMLDGLDSARWSRLEQALTTMAVRGPNRRLAAARIPAAVAVPDLVEPRHRAVVKAARRAKRSGVPADFHRLRIRCKRLRYSLEFTAGIYSGKTERFTRELARLQDGLGLMQDAEVATRRLLELATRNENGLPPITVFAMGGVAEHYRSEAHELLRVMPKRVQVVKGKSWDRLAEHMERVRRRLTPAEPRRPIPQPPVSPTTEVAAGAAAGASGVDESNEPTGPVGTETGTGSVPGSMGSSVMPPEPPEGVPPVSGAGAEEPSPDPDDAEGAVVGVVGAPGSDVVGPAAWAPSEVGGATD